MDQLSEKKKSELPAAHAKIVQAAMAEFSEKGFAGARMDSIASRASVNKAMLYYYIGDKRTLYEVVLHDVFEGLTTLIEIRMDKNRDAETNLLIYIRSIAETVERNFHIPAIILHEIAKEGKDLPEVVKRDLMHLLKILKKILQQGADEGTFERASPLLLHMLIMGPIMLYNRMASTILNISQKMKEDKIHTEETIKIGEWLEGVILKAVLKK